MKRENTFAYVFRFGMMPLMLFSGTFFPLSQLPGWLRALAYATPLWHGVALCRCSAWAVSAGRAAWSTSATWLCWGGVWAGARGFRGGSMSEAVQPV